MHSVRQQKCDTVNEIKSEQGKPDLNAALQLQVRGAGACRKSTASENTKKIRNAKMFKKQTKQ